ncbi:MAG: peptide chain release factor N(5)-glutamine methyltransferase [Pseudomonadota bacterium]|nr:peptide chain release factor N(5)-glutamine methyltransferase [Pseudomonadota bacterium]
MTCNIDTVGELLAHARRAIDGADAEILLAHAYGTSRSWLIAHADDACTAETHRTFQMLLKRRIAGEPVAYLTGRRGFWTLDLEVGPSTLIPRPETELLVELALARIPTDVDARVADLGTGSGAVALAVASERPLARVIATDASTAALDVARRNATHHALANVEFRCGDWFAPLRGEHFALIASNPPYIAENNVHLRNGDLRFEPVEALCSGDDGLDAIRTIVGDACTHLDASGWLLLEHGFDQGEVVRGLLVAAGFIQVETMRDLEDRDRVTSGRKP